MFWCMFVFLHAELQTLLTMSNRGLDMSLWRLLHSLLMEGNWVLTDCG